MAYMSTLIGDNEYGAEIDGQLAYGLFRRRSDGTWQQLRGAGQTPGFAAEGQFRRWALRETRPARMLERESRQPLSAQAVAIAQAEDDAAMEHDLRREPPQ